MKELFAQHLESFRQDAAKLEAELKLEAKTKPEPEPEPEVKPETEVQGTPVVQ